MQFHNEMLPGCDREKSMGLPHQVGGGWLSSESYTWYPNRHVVVLAGRVKAVFWAGTLLSSPLPRGDPSEKQCCKDAGRMET